MKIQDLEIPEQAIEIFKDIKELRPCQIKAIKAGLLDGGNFLVCSPTASGKTMVAEAAFLKTVLEKKKKAVYIVPLKALASEKYNDFKKKYEKIGIKIALSIGDLDSSEPNLEKCDLIVCTSEKLDSLIRHGASWLMNVGIVIIDEIHLITDIERGPTLEILITMIRKIVKNLQIIGLSATIGNPEELAKWLDAKLVLDDWRPVKLYEGVFFGNNVDFFNEKKNLVIDGREDATILLALDTIKLNKQALVFVNTKRGSEATAERIAKEIRINDEKHDKKLEGISDEILNCLSAPTKQCERLAKVIKKGIAFHHSGLVNKQREIIEKSFRNGMVKLICCTPTLSMGIDLPTFRSILKDLRRYGSNGMDWISTLEYKQQAGRCGRPSYDEFGEAICIASTDNEKEEIYERFINGDIEDIYSKLAVEPVLRTFLLSLIASEFINTKKGILDFFKDTFYAYQFENLERIEEKIDTILGSLIEYGFIVFEKEKIRATTIGKRVSQLYIDPESAYHLICCIKKTRNRDLNDISLLQAVSYLLEMRPWFKVRMKEFDEINEKLISEQDKILMDIPSEYDLEYERFIDSFKTSVVLLDHADEINEEGIMERYNIRPGELRGKIEIADWLLYSFFELARLLEFREILNTVSKLRVRLKYGAKEELLELLKLKNIGRVRARILFSKGIKNLRDVKEVEFEKLVGIIGQGIAADIKKQLGINVEKKFIRIGQQKIHDY